MTTDAQPSLSKLIRFVDSEGKLIDIDIRQNGGPLAWVKPGRRTRFTITPKYVALRIDRLSIEGCWMLNDVRIGGLSQFEFCGSCATPEEDGVPGDMLSDPFSMPGLKFDNVTVQTAMDVALDVTYCGDDPEGVPFALTAHCTVAVVSEGQALSEKRSNIELMKAINDLNDDAAARSGEDLLTRSTHRQEPTVHGLTRAQLEAQLTSAIQRRCWWAEDAIRADLRALDQLGGKRDQSDLRRADYDRWAFLRERMLEIHALRTAGFDWHEIPEHLNVDADQARRIWEQGEELGWSFDDLTMVRGVDPNASEPS